MFQQDFCHDFYVKLEELKKRMEKKRRKKKVRPTQTHIKQLGAEKVMALGRPVR